jgi:L-lactate utilization protein LutB
VASGKLKSAAAHCCNKTNGCFGRVNLRRIVEEKRKKSGRKEEEKRRKEKNMRGRNRSRRTGAEI